MDVHECVSAFVVGTITHKAKWGLQRARVGSLPVCYRELMMKTVSLLDG